ncbi:zinc finger protein OZF-like [Xyrichtys novacula]|uniref:Zinc finger protein OZF-like n=1 Tax=Xyrichtys novacula TaxID=13765 RepID=A0AAV1GUT3_XYRNO|nr:zinc finger protein OZF-like [Xyrichtys novacula]
MSGSEDLKDLSGLQLRAAVNRDLGENITTSGYKEELELDVIPTPLQRAVFPADIQQLLISEEEFIPEKQERSSSLDLDDTEIPDMTEKQVQLQPQIFPFNTVIVKSEDDDETPQPETELQAHKAVLGKEVMAQQGVKEEDPETQIIKNEQEEIKISQADTISPQSTPVQVKIEDDEEKPQTSQPHRGPTEQMKTGADGEDFGGPEPSRNSDLERDLQPESEDSSEPDTEDSDDWRENTEHSGLRSVKNLENKRQNDGKESHSCLECGKTVKTKWELTVHLRIHKGEKPLSCSVCSKRFYHKGHLRSHMVVHTEDKPFSCPDCGRRFKHKCSLKLHIAHHKDRKSYISDQRLSGYNQLNIHNCMRDNVGHAVDLPHSQTEMERDAESGSDGEDCGGPVQVELQHEQKLTLHLSCPVCCKNFKQKGNLNAHMFIHTGEKPFSCSVCSKKFRQQGHLSTHMVVHTGEKPFSCSVCSKRFNTEGSLKRHMRGHTGEKPFSCSVCSKGFSLRGPLALHMAVHTEEKPFSCSLCGKRFKTERSLKKHMVGHSCSLCGERFSWFYQVKKHKCV